MTSWLILTIESLGSSWRIAKGMGKRRQLVGRPAARKRPHALPPPIMLVVFSPDKFFWGSWGSQEVSCCSDKRADASSSIQQLEEVTSLVAVGEFPIAETLVGNAPNRLLLLFLLP